MRVLDRRGIAGAIVDRLRAVDAFGGRADTASVPMTRLHAIGE